VFNSIFDGTPIPLLQKLAQFGEQRQQVLAGNVANFDTPNYKRRDLPVDAFQNAMREAIAARHLGGAQGSRFSAAQTASAESGLSGPFPAQLFQAVEATSPSMTFQDNNNRSIEHEMLEMTKNAMMQSFAVELMNAQMGMLQAAIRGQA
jgi:flagellar basal-body rod protein FlgB